MVRTVNEEPCTICRRITNYYSQNFGRVCPKDEGMMIERASGYELVDEIKHLRTDPLIDHSNDIDKRE